MLPKSVNQLYRLEFDERHRILASISKFPASVDVTEADSANCFDASVSSSERILSRAIRSPDDVTKAGLLDLSLFRSLFRSSLFRSSLVLVTTSPPLDNTGTQASSHVLERMAFGKQVLATHLI